MQHFTKVGGNGERLVDHCKFNFTGINVRMSGWWLWENKVRIPSGFAISSLLKKSYLVTEIINFIEEICHQIQEN